jgi:hypothetical protein
MVPNEYVGQRITMYAGGAFIFGKDGRVLVPFPSHRDVLAPGGLVQLVAELGIGGGGRPQRDSRLG